MFHRCHARLDFSSPNNARLFKEAQDKRVTYIEEGLVNKLRGINKGVNNEEPSDK